MPAKGAKGSEMGQPVVHFEIGCRDKAKTGEFYKQLFDWTIESMGPADMINTGSDTGIAGHITTPEQEPHNYVTIYVSVEDLQAAIAKAEELGGKIIVPPTEVPEAGHFALIADPEGTTIGLWKPKG